MIDLLQLVLAAPPPAPPTGDGLSALYLLIGGQVVLTTIGMIAGLVRWLGSRTVEREDKDKEDLRAQIRLHDARFKELEERNDERFEELEDSIAALDKTMTTMQAEMKQLLTKMDAVREALGEMKGGWQTFEKSLDNRFDKQGDFYRNLLKEHAALVSDKLEKLEFSLRQDTSRAIHDAQTLRSKGR